MQKQNLFELERYMKKINRKSYRYILSVIMVALIAPATARDYSYMDDHAPTDSTQTIPSPSTPTSENSSILDSIIGAAVTTGVDSVDEAVRPEDDSVSGRFYKNFRKDQQRRDPNYRERYEQDKYYRDRYEQEKYARERYDSQYYDRREQYYNDKYWNRGINSGNNPGKGNKGKEWSKEQRKAQKKREKERRKYYKNKKKDDDRQWRDKEYERRKEWEAAEKARREDYKEHKKQEEAEYQRRYDYKQRERRRYGEM